MQIKKLRKGLFLAVGVMIFSSSATLAQVDKLANMMAGGVGDAEKLFSAYLTPYANGLGADLSAGWYNTAKVHKTGGFDITVTFNTAIIPESDKSFDLRDLNLSDAASPSDFSSPTAAGAKNPGPQITYKKEGKDLVSYDLPKGSGFGYTPAPMIQAGVGLVKGTSVMGRFTPQINVGDAGEVSLWGVGVKHSVKQWIPALKRLPVLHLSVMAGYTQLNSATDFQLLPSFYNSTETYNEMDYDDQQMELEVRSFTANMIVSANLPVVSFYGAVGIARTKTNLALTGNYPVPELNEEKEVVLVDIRDPFSIDIENNDGSATKPRFNAGMRFKFAVVTLHFDYTYANYSVATAGLGISFR
ncbi:MAG: DUF6588 family protein [Bacteroidota bacterium]